ncbi:MAG: 2-oxoacid:ferredoxin oxidoreductase subunit beta [Deltaproteobacteria bacterium]|nr:2-oxoacid:ferredoxin oxidoreductase subunit beta [Deltaproteobacteria bacterium]MBW2049090.1 2-oxoacid:ferredoxin oxidoreductase subunit beta [Deltaproteobacteria bacterium]MBW2111614.1 2-oxoacid:ferredoxin oxidoreductase subunit beta [Deltaproteobacteria bacterium]MBW2353772.1 2-oxoacid:ferredoxin oxidoreductase subunit beta [Deltaproteobacteria bacterium]HDZ90393.1 2-oxoacid:ferredoxin oxidoreductase subunit beta [Deltaproteobacteria bacterium]
MNQPRKQETHPLDGLLRVDRIPHIWCPGCGIGTAFSASLIAMRESGIDLEKTVMVSGIGCSGRGAGYVNLDSYHTTHGRAIPFATGMKLAKPELNVVVFSGDGDLFAIGGNHFIHAARRNVDLTVVCVNNFNYGMTGGQVAATTPINARTTTTPAGNPDGPFNLPLLAYASGATYVARWTILHTRELMESIQEALLNRGFSFVEILSPCPINYGRRNKESGIASLKIYQDKTIIRNDARPWELEIDFDRGIVLGKFIETERPTCTDRYDSTCRPKELLEGEKTLE